MNGIGGPKESKLGFFQETVGRNGVLSVFVHLHCLNRFCIVFILLFSNLTMYISEECYYEVIRFQCRQMFI
jgi:hypothetical protein